ncbi:hypothetical protein E1301_Tti012117 [Triplophysa tibetana]|uniref:Ubiquitin-like domain-containing protein n=1 Tax=Triplophysa tibetana TaxID=1572043 RepID=A0A5A9PJS3_9TELE|nr:hypothetical protein E1301_Tti012117 [Triplophysa tibetana]
MCFNCHLRPFVTIVLQNRYEQCILWECVRGDPQDVQPIPFHPTFKNTIHSVLTVRESIGLNSPIAGPVDVNIFNGSDGTSVPLKMENTDTVGKLMEIFLRMKPDFKGTVDLAYNGKPVKAHQTMAELQVKPGTTFITYQRCIGG